VGGGNPHAYAGVRRVLPDHDCLAVWIFKYPDLRACRSRSIANAAQVVSGIGFLGAGAILARGEIVKGLTTAASIWTVAAIGLAVGGGLYLAAGASTIIILIILAGIKPLEEAYRSRNQSCQLKIEVDNGSLTPDLLREALGLRIGQVKRFLVEGRNPQGWTILSFCSARFRRMISRRFPRN